MFVLYIIVINRLNKIWNSFQILFYLGQRFLNQFYLSTNRTFFLIYLGWWIISWSLKYLYIVYIIPNLCSFITSINTTRKLINTNGNTEGITVGKKLKQSKKKWWRVIFTNGITDGFTDGIYSVGKFVGKLWTLFIMLITKGITDEIFHRYFPESKSPTDWKVIGVIWRFSEKIQLI